MELNFDCSSIIFDTTCLSHFAIIDRIDVLGDFVNGLQCHSTSVVLEEIRRGIPQHPELERIQAQEWITFQRLDDDLERLTRFVHWSRLLGADNSRNFGEASVLALATELGATALVDDLSAKRVAKRHYDQVHGTLWLLAEVWRLGGATEVQLCNLVDLLANSGMRLPCRGNEFPNFVKENKLGRRSKSKR